MFKFHPLEVVSRYSDPQLQVSKMYSYLLKATQSGQNGPNMFTYYGHMKEPKSWLLHMPILCEHVHRLELRKSFKFWVAVAA